jgi:hypothetical protein
MINYIKQQILFTLSIFMLIGCGVSSNNTDFKLDNNINESWVRQVGNTDGFTDGSGVAVDVNNNIYVTGFTTVGISGESQKGNRDYFIAKYNNDGDLLWTRQAGNINGGTMANGIAVDKNSNIYIVGSTTADISGDGQKGNYDYFIAKYNNIGNLLWIKQIGDTNGNSEIISVFANMDNIYIVGNTSVGLLGESQKGNYDYFVAKYKESTLLWEKQVGGIGGDSQATGVVSDNDDNVYIVGNTSVGLLGESQKGNYDYFVAKYDAIGNLLWIKQVGSTLGQILPKGIVLDNNKNLYLTGYTTVGISGESQKGNYDYFIAKYKESNLLWTKQRGNIGGFTAPFGIKFSNNNIYVVGFTSVDLFGDGQKGNYDYFIAKYNESNLLLAKQFGNNLGNVYGYGITVDAAGVYVVGSTSILISNESQRGIRDYFVAKHKF